MTCRIVLAHQNNALKKGRKNEKVDPNCNDCGRCGYDAPGSGWRDVRFRGQDGLVGEYPGCDGTCLRTESSGADLPQKPFGGVCNA
jgi:hypothetical protein